MTDPESPKEPKSLLSHEDNFEQLTQELSSLRTWLANFTQKVDILPRKTDLILDILTPLNTLIEKEFVSKNELLESFKSIQSRFNDQIKQFESETSNLHENLVSSNDFLRKIESLRNEQNTSQSEYNNSLQLLFSDFKQTASILKECQNKLRQSTQSLNSEVENSVKKIRLDVENTFSNYFLQFQTLEDEWKTLQYQSNQTILECQRIISIYQNSQVDLSRNISQASLSKNKFQKFINRLNTSFESRLLLTSIISSLVTAITVFSLGLIAVKLFSPQENSSFIKNNHKNSNVKPVQKLNQ
jgi:hypothetical protein